jgi:hypothetical protein
VGWGERVITTERCVRGTSITTNETGCGMRRESTTVFSDFSEINCFWEYDGANIFRLKEADSDSEILLSGEQALMIASFVLSKISEHIE